MLSLLKKVQRVLVLILAMAALGCGAESQNNDSSGSASPAPAVADANAPSAGNLPPPGSESNSLSAQNTIFFQQKGLWDSFSGDLKKKVQENYANSGSMMGAGAGGHGYYNTLFGRVSPAFGMPSVLPPVQIQTEDGKTVYYQVMAQTVGCDAAASFLCVDKPVEGENTVVDSVLVEGKINMTEAALFSPTDPIILISVFRQSGEPVNSYALSAADITITPPASPGDPEIGSFSKPAGLSGPGSYAILISAFKDAGDTVELVSFARTVIRQDVPEIELISLLPPADPDPGNLYPTDVALRHAPVHGGDTVSMNLVTVKVKLKTPGTSNVGIQFQNLDTGGVVRYVSAGGAFGEEDEPQPDGSTQKITTKSADLPLFDGLNHIKITAHNTLLDTLGLSPATPSTIEFNLTNVSRTAKIKLIEPKDGKVIEASGNANQKVTIQFCLTDLPNLPGRPSPAPAGECITNWPETDNQKPEVTYNGYKLPADQVSRDSSGNYTAQVKPLLGGNVFTISALNTSYGVNASFTASFGFGKVNKLFENNDLKEENNFLARGLNLEIHKKVITDLAKTMIEKFLNRPEFKTTFINLFKNESPGITNVCTEVEGYTIDTGDSTINLLPETVTLGKFEILQLEPQNDNRLHIRAKVGGFTGEADIRGLNSTVQVQEDGVDLSFIPISIGIKEMTISVDLTFPKKNGLSQIDLLKDPNFEIVEIVGTDALGRFVWINPARNALAQALADTYGPGDVMGDLFFKSLKRTFVCGLENNLNNATTGLGQWQSDLKKLVSYNSLNPFRIPLEFDLLNKLIGIDIAYDALRGDITFNDRGVQLRNVPLRFSASPRTLNHLVDLLQGNISVDDQSEGDKKLLASPNRNLIGSLSAPTKSGETPPQNPATTEIRNLGFELSEDALNQALFSANMAGLLDLDIDPNFFTNNDIEFIDQATPTIQDMLALKIDLNGNGVDDDDRLPILLRLTTDKTLAPHLHFLTQSEVNEIAALLEAAPGSGGGDSPETEAVKLNKNLKYFRLSLSNLEIGVYRVYPLGGDVAGIKTFCSLKNNIPEPADDAAARPTLPDFNLTDKVATKPACQQLLPSFFEKTSASCPESGISGNDYNEVQIPVKNGPIVSAIPGQEDVSVVRFKVNLVLHGVIQGVFREILAADKYEVDHTVKPVVLKPKANPKPTNFLRIKFLTNEMGSLAPLAKLSVVENHTPFTENDLGTRLARFVILAAVGEDCQRLNEIQVPLPERFPSETATSSGGLMETLSDFEVHHIDFGGSAAELPQAFIDDNRLYVDVLAHLDVCYLGEACAAPAKKSLSKSLIGKIPLSAFDWKKH